MYKNFFKMIRNKRMSLWLDTFALITVMQYVSYRFLQSTMFDFVYSNKYKSITFGLVVLAGAIRFCYIAAGEIEELKNRKEIIRYLSVIAGTALLALPLVYTGWKHDYKFLIFLPFVALCLYRMNPQRVLRYFVWTVGILLAATVLCSLAGAVRNLVFEKHGRAEAAYGIINTTDFASYISFLLLFVWCILKKKGLAFSTFTAVAAGIIGFINYWISDSSTALFTGILTVIAILWEGLDRNIICKKAHLQSAGKRIKQFAVFIVPVVCTVLAVLIILYANQNPLALRVDELLNGRLRVSWNAIEQYGIHLFGSSITVMHGNGGTMIPFNWHVNGYGYIDVAYTMLMVRYGWLVFTVVIGFWLWMMRKCFLAGENRIALAMLVISLHAVTEARFLDINYNIFLGMPFSSFVLQKEETEQRIQQPDLLKNRNYFAKLSAVVIGTVLCVLMPIIQSWLRTIFSLEGFTTGIHAWGALLISVTLILLVIAFWKTVCLLWKHRNIKYSIILGIILLLIGGGIIAGNRIIQKGIDENTDRLAAEEEIIRQIQSCADNPVLAAESSELYQRKYGGFTEHAFSTDELIRIPNGTIITNRTTDATGIMMIEGALYAQISSWSGMYTYDTDFADRLSSAGIRFEPFYYSERCSDLTDLAVRNGLAVEENGSLRLNGPEHSVINHLWLDQFSGVYEVRYTISCPGSSQYENGKQICVLKVLGEAGDRLIMEQPVDAAEFDETGKCSITLSYEIRSTPKVSYQVIAEDDTELLVEEIAWKRIV